MARTQIPISTEFPASRHWEDWVGLAVGLWLFASPWLLHYRETAAGKSAFLVASVLIVTELIALSTFLIWEEWFSVMLGAWLALSPWVLGAAFVPAVNLAVVGLAVMALAFYVIRDERRHHPHSAHPA
jgi:SPW repeat-containing protein